MTFLLLQAVNLAGCTNMQRLAHSLSTEAPDPHSFYWNDGGRGIYYSFTVGEEPDPDTWFFFYGGTGCASWKYVMPGYVTGLTVPARVFALNKRYVDDRSTGMTGCGNEFHEANNPAQWAADYEEFIVAMLRSASKRPKYVVLVGVSEGGLTAATVARRVPGITHLGIIGDGGYTMRRSLAELHRKGLISFNVASGWEQISSDPRSIEKKWYGNTYRWWSDVMDIDPMPTFLGLDIPILVVMGERDSNVPVGSALFLRDEFEKAGKKNLMVRIYPQANHLLKAGGHSFLPDFFRELGELTRNRTLATQ